MKMKTEEKHEWIAALMSGDHIQGQGVLNDTNTKGLCCLGVLCELSKERCNLKIEIDQAGYVSYDDDTNGLCKNLRDRYKTEHPAGFLVPIEHLTVEELRGQNQVTNDGLTGVWISDLIDLCVEAV